MNKDMQKHDSIEKVSDPEKTTSGIEWRWQRPKSLPEQIASQISDAILTGIYEPGDRIREQDIAIKFSVSRGPVREALRLLEKDGVVSIIPNRGAQVTKLSISEVQEIFEIRAALLAVAVEIIIELSDKNVIQHLQAGAKKLGNLARKPNAQEAYVKASAELAQFIAISNNNTKLCEILNSLARQTTRYTQLGLASNERIQASALIWQQAVDAISSGDKIRACSSIRKLINDSRNAAILAIQST